MRRSSTVKVTVTFFCIESSSLLVYRMLCPVSYKKMSSVNDLVLLDRMSAPIRTKRPIFSAGTLCEEPAYLLDITAPRRVQIGPSTADQALKNLSMEGCRKRKATIILVRFHISAAM